MDHFEGAAFSSAIKPDVFQIRDYLNRSFECNCKKTHVAFVKEIDISEGAIENTPAYINRLGYKKVFVVYDVNTYEAAGRKLEKVFCENCILFSKYILDPRNVVPDEDTVGKIMIAVGSGTINDLCKFISYKVNLDYFIIATAPSMDGFSSSVAALIVNNMKITYETHVATAIIADTDILKNAPPDMIRAGIGDIIGKYTCLYDWKLSNIINGKYYCNVIVDMVKRSIKIMLDKIKTLKPDDPNITAGIMEALVITGIAISFSGNSRPASGSEHHLSHFWEMQFLFQEREPVLHGIKVATATLAVIKAYELLLKSNIDFNNARKMADTFQFEAWSQDMSRIYGSAAEGVIGLEKTTHKNRKDNVLKHIDMIEKNWDTITGFLREELPSSGYISDLLEKLGIPLTPNDLGVNRNMMTDSFIAAKELRQRYGLLQLLFDLGILNEFAEIIA